MTTARVARWNWLRNAAGLADLNYWRGTLQPRPTVDWYVPSLWPDYAASAGPSKTADRSATVAYVRKASSDPIWLPQACPCNCSCVLMRSNL